MGGSESALLTPRDSTQDLQQGARGCELGYGPRSPRGQCLGITLGRMHRGPLRPAGCRTDVVLDRLATETSWALFTGSTDAAEGKFKSLFI